MVSRREFLKLSGASAGALMAMRYGLRGAFAQIPGGSLAPGDVDKYTLPLVKPPAMPPSKTLGNKDLYRIAVQQFRQRILSPGTGTQATDVTTVWSYGSVDQPGTAVDPDDFPNPAGGTFNYPAFTVEAKANRKVSVEWRNELVDMNGNYLPHLLPVDQTLHWANPPGGKKQRDRRGFDPTPYMGPVPMVTHVHGAHVSEESDGYAEAWWLPYANDIPKGYATTGTFYDYFLKKYKGGWDPGTATFDYTNDQPATTLWYHDHTLGMTRLNVYAGPAGYWLIRGGGYDADLGYVAPGVGDSPLGEYTEIPIVIQDRSFNADGSLFYPDNRAFFEGLAPGQLQIPFIPDEACDGLPSDVSPIWNPEFFGNMMVVNGFTWPFLEVEQRRYRFRFLNGCNSRFLNLKMTTTPRMNNGGFNTPEFSFWQIGAEQGFLPAPVKLDYLLMAPAERADVIVDFSGFDVGDEIYLVNDGPDAPFGGVSLEDLSDWESTGQVMKFKVKAALNGDTTTPPDELVLPPQPVLPATDVTRQVSLNEEESASVRVSEVDGNIVLDCETGEVFGPTSALLGTLNPDMEGNPLLWMDPITENPAVDATEEWEIHNFTEDAHPIHVHLVKFAVVNREDGDGNVRDPEPWETGFKDTVISYPGEITRIKMNFDLPGFYVWHCHIVEHEDNEMMRPYVVGPQDPKAPHPMP
jgi:FtsP/CotA-like multicopper oxidase with cupredoxin domain